MVVGGSIKDILISLIPEKNYNPEPQFRLLNVLPAESQNKLLLYVYHRGFSVPEWLYKYFIFEYRPLTLRSYCVSMSDAIRMLLVIYTIIF